MRIYMVVYGCSRNGPPEAATLQIEFILLGDSGWPNSAEKAPQRPRQLPYKSNLFCWVIQGGQPAPKRQVGRLLQASGAAKWHSARRFFSVG